MHYTSLEVYEYISKQTNDPIVEWRICEISGTKFAVYQSDLDFYQKISPTFDGQTFQIPTPRLCPEERQRRRLMFRNERKLYKRKCDATGETIISVYAPNNQTIAYHHNVWRSDERDPMSYWINFDFNKSFTQNFKLLSAIVPRTSIHVIWNENCDYLNQCWYSKDCYLCFNTDYSSWCLYTKDCDRCTMCVDCQNWKQSERCFQCINFDWCNSCFYSVDIINSTHMYGCEHMIWCDHCIACNSMQNASFCIKNKQISEEEFRKYLNDHKYYVSAMSHYKNQRKVLNSKNSYGSSLYNSNNIIFSYNIHDSQDLKYCYDFVWSQDTYDHSTWWYNTKKCYEMISSGDQNYNCIFNSELRWNDSNLIYSQFCIWSSFCFWCIWLRNKKYCIFNKQYTKEDYEKIVAKIITYMQDSWEWWEFFQPSLSLFGYNETVAHEYFPLTREEALGRWYARQDNTYDPVIPSDIQTFTWDDIPIDPHSVDDSISKKILICEVSRRPFRIIQQELNFYRKHKLPLPRKHPDIRHQERLEKRPKRELHLRTCDKTWEQILSVYPQNVSFEVYGEEAYKKEMYG